VYFSKYLLLENKFNVLKRTQSLWATWQDALEKKKNQHQSPESNEQKTSYSRNFLKKGEVFE